MQIPVDWQSSADSQSSADGIQRLEAVVGSAKVIRKSNLQTFPWGNFRTEQAVWVSTAGGQEGNSAYTVTYQVLEHIRDALQTKYQAWQTDANVLNALLEKELAKHSTFRATELAFEDLSDMPHPFGKGGGLKGTSFFFAAEYHPPQRDLLPAQVNQEPTGTPSRALWVVEFSFRNGCLPSISAAAYTGCPSPLGSRL